MPDVEPAPYPPAPFNPTPEPVAQASMDNARNETQFWKEKASTSALEDEFSEARRAFMEGMKLRMFKMGLDEPKEIDEGLEPVLESSKRPVEHYGRRWKNCV